VSEAQRARAERNRLKALSLKKARLLAHPYTEGQVNASFNMFFFSDRPASVPVTVAVFKS
jgi:hypothetical protein